jgi:hypothetical protein
MEKRWPAIKTVPVRRTPVVFARIVGTTNPLPVPLDGSVTEIHGTSVVAVHGQPAGAPTVMMATSAGDGEFLLAGVIE